MPGELPLLIADDSVGKIEMIRAMLQRAHWHGDILIAQTTEEAIEMIDVQPIGFAFIDYYIPSQNGPAVIAFLKNKFPSARVALVSSADKKENFEEAKGAGAEICIYANDDAETLERTFMDLLEQWQSEPSIGL